jgi:hypothetical protein
VRATNACPRVNVDRPNLESPDLIPHPYAWGRLTTTPWVGPGPLQDPSMLTHLGLLVGEVGWSEFDAGALVSASTNDRIYVVLREARPANDFFESNAGLGRHVDRT